MAAEAGAPQFLVLVVEDDELVREMLVAMLQVHGYAVAAAADGREALELHRETPADLVVADLFLPVQDGFRTIAALREQSPDVKIIAISGGGTALDLERSLSQARSLGADRALGKPVGMDELMGTVAELLQQRH
jgi:CheY-like chemotaxis protein